MNDEITLAASKPERRGEFPPDGTLVEGEEWKPDDEDREPYRLRGPLASKLVFPGMPASYWRYAIGIYPLRPESIREVTG